MAVDDEQAYAVGVAFVTGFDTASGWCVPGVGEIDIRLRTVLVSMMMGLFLAGAPGIASAAQATEQGPFPYCGDHIQITRSSSTVRVVGVELNRFSSRYMLVWVSDSSGKSYGAYNASPYGGANFQLSTGSTSKRTFYVSLTNDSNTQTLCQDSYYR